MVEMDQMRDFVGDYKPADHRRSKDQPPIVTDAPG
jgi:hypothetical protein